MSEPVPPELVGQMATVGTTNLPLGMCPSCSRALIYGALTYAGAVKGDVELGLLDSAQQRLSTMLSMLVQFVQADFDSSMPAGTDLDEDDYTAAIDAFLRSRMDTYISGDGQILFEPHETDA